MTATDASLFLRRSLMANATFSGLSGLVFLFAAGPIGRSIGLDEPIAIVVVGGFSCCSPSAWLAMLAARS
jgi:hypothetical protein